MKKSYTYLTMLLTVFAFASCVKEFDNENGSPAKGTMPIEFTIADDATRTLLDLKDGKSVVWEDGDVVGLIYRYTDESDVKIYPENAFNIPYRYDAQTGMFKPVGEPAYWDDGAGSSSHNLYVYYPFTAETTAYNSIPSAVPSSQTYDVTATLNPVVKSSFAGTRVQSAAYGKAVTFSPIAQSFAIFRLNITNVSGSDVVINEVVISNDSKNIASDNITMTTANYLEGAPKVQSRGDNSKEIIVSVKNGTVAAGESIDVRVLMVPNDNDSKYTETYEGSKFTVAVTSDKGEHPEITFDGGMIAVGGRAAKNIVLKAPSTSDVPSAPEYEIGQVVGGGVLYKIDGTTGYVLHPQAGSAKFATNKSKMSSDLTSDLNDGRTTMTLLKNKSADLSDYPAAKYCYDLGEDWYLPSQNEWVDLFNVFTGNDTGSTDDFKVATSTLDQKYKDARATFDGYLTACGGDALSTPEEDVDSDGKGYNYWLGTITTSGTKPRYSRVDSYAMTSTETVTYSYKVRCIRRVDLTVVDQPETEQTYPAPTAGEDGDYDVYLLIGQSNMAGRGELLDEDKVAIPNVYILNTEGEIEPAKNPLNIYSSIRKAASSQLMGPGASFASTITAQTGKKVLLVVNARGGSAISQWQKGVTTSSSGNTYGPSSATSADFYNEAVTRTKQAMQYGALKGILWHQGCSDQSNTSYMTQLMQLANNLRKDLGGDVPFIAGQLGDWRSSSANFNVRIQGIGQYLTYSDWVSSEGGVPIVTKDSNGEPDKSDPHFNRASQILIGKRYAQKILKMVYEKDYTVE